MIELRAAEKDDSAFGLRLYTETMRPLLSALGEWDDKIYRERFIVNLQSSFCFVIMYRLDNVSIDIGWLQMSISSDIEITQLHLIDDYRSRGIGTAIFRAIADFAGSARKGLFLSVAENNRAIELYERLGFQTVSRAGWKIRMQLQ